VYSSCQSRSFEFSLATKEGSLIVERDFNKVELQDKRHQKSFPSELYHLSKLYHQSLCHISCHREQQYLQPSHSSSMAMAASRTNHCEHQA